MFNLISIVNTKKIILLFTLTTLILTAKTNSTVPDVPEFSMTYLGEALVCSPDGLIKTKTHKDQVTYQCSKMYTSSMGEKKEEEKRGADETRRLASQVKGQIAKGNTYSVQIPLYEASNPERAKLLAKRQLENKPYGKYLRMFLPAKIYLSIRPQLANTGNDGNWELLNGGSRGGFFYYYQFNDDLELAFHYEAKVNLQDNTPFINTSENSLARRLSYLLLKSGKYSIIAGKYWSAYYDIAGITDQYMAYGAQASGAFNAGTDGSPSGTGRAERMLQARIDQELYEATLQVQFKHDAISNFDTNYSYTAAVSFTYKGWENVKVGASVAYGKFDNITSEMLSIGITGNDWSSIIAAEYKKENFSVNATFSYTKNHNNDDQGIYFDSIGAELYMRYDIDDSIRLAGGGNWLIPKDTYYYQDDDSYSKSRYSIQDLIVSLQYTFGEKTFDDLVYLEFSFPHGKLSDGEKRNTSVAVGLRYLLSN